MKEIRNSWFGDGHPLNCKGSSITIGAGANGQVIVTSITVIGEESNGIYTLEVVEGVGNNIAMGAVFLNGKITVTLGTDGAGVLDPAKNTALLVGAAINALPNFSATHSGTGATSLAVAEADAPLVGGQYGTECPEPMVVVRVWNAPNWDYYTTIAPNGKYETNWRKFNLIEY